MLSSVGGFLRRRQRGLAVVSSVLAGGYLAAQYARARFAELSERLVTDRAAKENLRRRFQQAQEDCAFTVQALLPTLAKQVLEELDVEALTAELQRRAEETRKAKGVAQALEQSTASALGQSWDALSASEQWPAETREAAQVPLPEAGHDETDFLADEISQSHMNGHIMPPEAQPEPQVPPDPRTKAELWQAIKVMTFHRTVAALYLLCLLAVQTHVQLNLLGRYNYVNSVYEQAWKSATSQANGHAGLFDDEELARRLKAELAGEKAEEEEDRTRSIDGHTEQQYLSCTWWLLWKGWRDISERVRIATEEVLENVSLKSQLGADDLRKLLVEIRRKVEYEPTGACHSFASATFPMSGAAEQETLEQSGLGDTSIGADFRGLLDETKDFLEAPDSSVVLRSCLDKAFSRLSASVAHLFVDDTSVAASESRFEELQDRKVRLAAVLPALARASHSVLNTIPNEFAEAIAENRELQEFSAVVYSNFAVSQ